jgi:hypothetical protein
MRRRRQALQKLRHNSYCERGRAAFAAWPLFVYRRRGKAAQRANDGRDVILLKEPNPCDSSRARPQTRFRILQIHPSEREHWHSRSAGQAKSIETGGAGSGRAFLFKDGTENGERSVACGSFDHFFW